LNKADIKKELDKIGIPYKSKDSKKALENLLGNYNAGFINLPWGMIKKNEAVRKDGTIKKELQWSDAGLPDTLFYKKHEVANACKIMGWKFSKKNDKVIAEAN
jgi:hypothetical protein